MQHIEQPPAAGVPVSDLTRRVIRLLASMMLGFGIFAIVSGSMAVISASLVISQAALWLGLSSREGGGPQGLLERAAFEMRGVVCCSSSHGTFHTLRGLAIACIVLATFEVITILVINNIIGSNIINYSYYGYNYRSCEGYNSYCCSDGTVTSYYSDCYNRSSSSSYGGGGGIAQWLIFFAGQISITAPLNIGWSTLTLQMVGAIIDAVDPRPLSASSPLLYQQPPSYQGLPPQLPYQPQTSWGGGGGAYGTSGGAAQFPSQATPLVFATPAYGAVGKDAPEVVGSASADKAERRDSE